MVVRERRKQDASGWDHNGEGESVGPFGHARERMGVVEDCWHGSYDGDGDGKVTTPGKDHPTDGTAWQDGSSAGSNRVKRGGSWNNNANNVRAANRNNNDPANRNNNLGFRPARSRQRPVGRRPWIPAPRARLDHGPGTRAGRHDAVGRRDPAAPCLPRGGLGAANPTTRRGRQMPAYAWSVSSNWTTRARSAGR